MSAYADVKLFRSVFPTDILSAWSSLTFYICIHCNSSFVLVLRWIPFWWQCFSWQPRPLCLFSSDTVPPITFPSAVWAWWSSRFRKWCVPLQEDNPSAAQIRVHRLRAPCRSCGCDCQRCGPSNCFQDLQGASDDSDQLMYLFRCVLVPCSACQQPRPLRLFSSWIDAYSYERWMLTLMMEFLSGL